MARYLTKSIIFIVAIFQLLACAEIKEAGRSIGHTTRNVTRDIGHGSRDTVHILGDGTKRVFHSVTADPQ
jgi:hypothetical protein